jgi:hypothetical protein
MLFHFERNANCTRPAARRQKRPLLHLGNRTIVANATVVTAAVVLLRGECSDAIAHSTLSKHAH